MTRRIVRTAFQLGVLSLITFLMVFFLDNRYRLLPQSIHSHMPVHHEDVIITDLTVYICKTPFSACLMDQTSWQRIEKNLFLGKTWGKAYIHVKKKKEEELTSDDKVILDIKVGRLDPSQNEKAQEHAKWEAKEAGIWVKRAVRRHAGDASGMVTALDVLYGSDCADPRPGWEVKNPGLLLDGINPDYEPHLTVRKGRPPKIEKHVPRVGSDGKFKIMQISDLHLSTGLGKCRDPEPPNYNGGKCAADERTFEFVRRVLGDEKPDLVVLSGDQVNGDTAPDAQSAIFKLAEIFAEERVLWAAIFGNHDDEKTLSREQSMALMTNLPYSLSKAGPNEISGVGNYYLEVLAHSSHHSALTLYFLDTHSYNHDDKRYKGYDWIKPDQIKWFQDTSQALKKSADHKKFAGIHMDMAFIHIPLPEYRDEGQEMVGKLLEGVMAPGYNSHFKDALVSEGVLTVSCGHDHANDYCALARDAKSRHPELWMCYAGGSGFGGYGGYGGYHRRIRVFDVDSNSARITTWKRLEYGDTAKRLDEQVIVDEGKVKPPRTAD